MSESNFRALSALSALALGVAAALAGCGGGDDDHLPTIAISGTTATATTARGPVAGSVVANTLAFRGIPFALPPVGARRWTPPVAAPAWSGTLNASQFAKHCPQPGALSSQPDASEDCLYLNVYTPKAIGAAALDKPRAVMVWIYGGANAIGASDYYDPSPLVEAEDVIVVTFNYRVGALGFLAHPALDGEGHAKVNYGVLDQQLALKWVQDHIAAFGGDKANVTIFGESAGALNTMTHIASPLSAGLFQKAIVQSGAYQLDTPGLAASEALGTAFATRIGCTDQSAACLRSKTVDEVLAQQGTVNTASSAFNQSTVDGQVLAESQRAALTAGRFNRVPVMDGANAHEGRTFTAPGQSEAAYQATLGFYASTLGKAPAEALATYSLAEYGTPTEALAAATGDFAFACSSRAANKLLSAFVPTYAYEFADDNASAIGAGHGAEIVYLMKVNPASGVDDVTGRGWAATGDSLTLSTTMRRYWAQFAKTGNPNAASVPNWAAFTAAGDNVQLLVPPTPRQDTGFAARHKCSFWG